MLSHRLTSFLLVLLLAASLPCIAQQQSNCTIPSILHDAYARDAADLAVKRMWATGHPDTASIFIPGPQLDSIWSPLSAIFALDAALQADSIFRHRCIHTANNWHLANGRQVIASVNDSFTWTGAWTIGNNITGYAALDSFCDRYGFTFLQNYHVGPAHYVLLHTAGRDINDGAFADSLATFDGILRVGRPTWMGDGDHLTYTRDTAAHFSFSLGWNDCPSGCIERKTWHYTVTNTCIVSLDSVTLSQAGGAPMPMLASCGLQPFVQTDATLPEEEQLLLRLYPNPATDLLWLDGMDPRERWTFRITDGLGCRVREGELSSHSPLSVGGLPQGAYLLHMRGSSGGRAAQPFFKK